MLTGVHFLLTYKCVYECDHCFLYCGPSAEGVFTISQVKAALAQMKEIKSIDTAYFEGGEPFMFYPLMVESLRLAKSMGYKVGIVTNGYWAISKEDALLWLEPLAKMGIIDLSVSDDKLHCDEGKVSPAKYAIEAARALSIPCDSICIEAPKVIRDDKKWQGEPVVGGDVLFKGRAVDKLIEGLPRRDYSVFNECPHEELAHPGRVHLDPFGNVHICQGISIGNINDTSLKKILNNYMPRSHPIIGPLLKGGPAELARKFDFDISAGFVDACHLCFGVRRKLLDRFPECLTPRQVYGAIE
jgi:MoaA/NifB/PqqE/SkfB family radical SAM enzyme